MIKTCMNCGKDFVGRKESKFCCKACANTFRRGKFIAPRVTKKCELCGKEFTISASANNNPKKCKRFCSDSCAAKWRTNTYGPNKMSDEAKKRMSRNLSDRWKNEEFRKKKIEYMKEHNPSKNPEIMQRIVQTIRQRGGYKNQYRFGNGKISDYEQKVYQILIDNGFYYNYAINTKIARDAFPEKRYANSYKPDFVNLSKKLCIEIDGHTHESKEIKQLDNKKEECLKFLGFSILRFTHEQIDKGEFDLWLNSYLKEC